MYEISVIDPRVTADEKTHPFTKILPNSFPILNKVNGFKNVFRLKATRFLVDFQDIIHSMEAVKQECTAGGLITSSRIR